MEHWKRHWKNVNGALGNNAQLSENEVQLKELQPQYKETQFLSTFWARFLAKIYKNRVFSRPQFDSPLLRVQLNGAPVNTNPLKETQLHRVNPCSS